MTGNFYVTTEDLSIVYSDKGPMLRFTLTIGFVETEGPKRQLLIRAEGCVGKSEPQKDPETGQVIPGFRKFIWDAPGIRLSRGIKQLITVTPDLTEAVIQALHSQGAVNAFMQRVANAEQTKPVQEILEGIEKTGSYVLA